MSINYKKEEAMGRENFDLLLAQHCAPTLSGLKAASMVALPGKSMADLEIFFQSYRQCFACKGLKIMELSQQKQHVLLLIYRPAVLARLLRRPLAKEILAGCGYPQGASLEELLAFLRQRMQSGEGFPHEIGLFLGYPPIDVAGFIKYRGQKFRHSGFWKVYANEKAVLRLFQCYDDCIQKACRGLQNGVSLESMIRAAA